MSRDQVIFIAGVVFCMGLHAQTGGVRGRVLSEGTDAPAAGATVAVVAQPADGPAGQPVIRQVVADEDGGFSIGQLPAGVYRVCVHDAGDRLDPCQWFQDIRAAVDAAVSTVDIRLRRGVRLAVRIQDSAGLVTALKNGSPALGAVPGALTNITLTDSAGRGMLLPLSHASERLYEYSALVPPDTDLTLGVSSVAFTLATASGEAVGTGGASIPVRVPVPPVRNPLVRVPFMPAGPPVHVVGFSITGLTRAVE